MKKDIEQKYKNKWKFTETSDDDLKKIAKDIYNGIIYTDRHCRENNITMVFMPILFMAPGSNRKDGVDGQRDNKIYDILEREIEQKYYEEYINQIGLIYEYLDKAGPMALNGQPIFYSCRFLSKEDTTKMFDYYEQYKEIREKADNF